MSTTTTSGTIASAQAQRLAAQIIEAEREQDNAEDRWRYWAARRRQAVKRGGQLQRELARHLRNEQHLSLVSGAPDFVAQQKGQARARIVALVYHVHTPDGVEALRLGTRAAEDPEAVEFHRAFERS